MDTITIISIITVGIALLRFIGQQLSKRNATLLVTLDRMGGGRYVLTVYNTGKAEAQNVRLNILEGPSGFADNEYTEDTLAAGDTFETRFSLIKEDTATATDMLVCRLLWDDKLKKGRFHQKSFNLVS